MAELTHTQVEQFWRDGYVVVGPLASPQTCAELRDAFQKQMQVWAADIGATEDEYLSVVSQWTNVWEHNGRFREQLFAPRASAIACQLLDCDAVRVFHDHLIVKPPGGGSTIPWHRDLPNWPVAEPRGLSSWLALDDVTVDSGAMRFMAGGHKEPMTDSIDFLNEVKDWGERKHDAVPVEVPAGYAIFHHCLSWHTSPPNTTDRWRRAYITVYLDSTCTFDPKRGGWHPMTGRVSAEPGQVFNADVFPILGRRQP